MSISEAYDKIARKAVTKNEVGDARLYGLITGVVTEIGEKENQGKVLVEVPTREKPNNSYWVSVSHSMAGNKWGGYLLPELGDVVKLAFDDGNIHNPTLVGSVYADNSEMPGRYFDKDNYIKAFETKGGFKVVVHDTPDEQAFELSVNDKHKFILDTKKNLMSITDKEGKNQITFNTENGQLMVKADSKLTIEVNESKLIIDGSSNCLTVQCERFEVKANQEVKIESQNVNIKGGTVNVDASSSAMFKSDGPVTVQGSAVKLN